MMQKFFTQHHYQRTLLLFFIFCLLDLLSKYLFFNLGRGSNSYFLEPAFNTGISFSYPLPSGLIIIGTLIIAVIFVFMYYKKIFSDFVFVMLSAGTIGNLVDRIMLGGVRDFLVMPGWFIFNLADVMLIVGVGLAVLAYMRNNP